MGDGMQHRIQVVLFDLGGVLIRLRGVKVLLSHLEGRVDEAGLMRRWLFSPAVRAFESGNCSLATFCHAIVAELDLPMDATGFLDIFRSFLAEPFPGVAETLPVLSRRMPIGILSNTSDPHWQAAREMLPELNAVKHLFLSYRMGLLKPDEAMFRQVLSLLDTPPATVLFFDDHPANVDAANATGMHAVIVKSFSETVEMMMTMGVLES